MATAPATINNRLANFILLSSIPWPNKHTSSVRIWAVFLRFSPHRAASMREERMSAHYAGQLTLAGPETPIRRQQACAEKQQTAGLRSG